MDIFLSNPLLLVGLAVLGLCVGFLTGLFGIGGAFITTPVMISLFGLETSLAVGCSMGFTLFNGALGLGRHSGKGNNEPTCMWSIAIAACVGTVVGKLFHSQLKIAMGERFDETINLMFCVILIPIGLIVWWQSKNAEGRPLLSRLRIPPMTKPLQENLPPVSLTLLALVGMAIGLLKGMLGLGGGIILVPFLVLVVGFSPHRAVVISLGMVVLSSIVGTIAYAMDGNVNFFVVGAMLTGSLIGVVLGARFCDVTSATRLKRLLATLILGFAVLLAWKTFS